MGVGWRSVFGLGVVFGLAVLLVRRNVPESPRWLLIHGRDREAEDLVDSIEQRVGRETGQSLPEPNRSLTIRQRKSIGFLTIAKTMFTRYPKRTVLGFSLFVGQAFLYNAITFGFAQILATAFHVSTSPGYYFAVIAAGNLVGPLLLGRLFDTLGRIPMIAGTYIASGGLLFVTAYALNAGLLTASTLTACWSVVLFFASAGASAAYLTVSEVFPMETSAGDRILLCDRHRRGWHHRPVGVLLAGQHREAGEYRGGVHHRGIADGRRRNCRTAAGGQGGTPEPGGHRRAAYGGRGENPASRSRQRCEPAEASALSGQRAGCQPELY